jgi:hypothetical protein
MIAGVRQRRAEIGLRLQQADQYQGLGEKSFAFLGKLGFKSAVERADNMKDDRIQQMTIDDGVSQRPNASSLLTFRVISPRSDEDLRLLADQ